MRRLSFRNPVFLPLIVLFFAATFNDWWAITIGLPTPVQGALLFGIYFFLFRYKTSIYHHFKQLRLLLILYLIMVGISTFYIYVTTDFFNITFITILINVLWVILAMPFLSLGFEEEDIIKFLKYVSYIIFFITIPVGLIEFITHKSFMSTDYGLTGQLFYVRSLHIDKIEFGCTLAWGIFIAVSFLGKKEKYFPSYFLVTLLFVSILLLSASFSTTSIFGVAAGCFCIVMQSNKKVLMVTPFVALVLFFSFELLKDTVLFSNILSSYDLKYQLNVTESEDRNYRYMSWDAAIHEIAESPIAGYGIGNSGKVVQHHFINNLHYFTNQYLDLTREVNTHNLLFNEMLDFGLLGFMPLLCVLIILYYFAFDLSNPYYIHDGYNILKKVLIAFGILLLFRFVLYYHRFDQTVYIIWMALVMGLRATRLNYRKEVII